MAPPPQTFEPLLSYVGSSNLHASLKESNKRNYKEQAEAEVVPSSSLVEIEDEVDVGVEVGILRCNLDLSLVVVSAFMGWWMV